MLSGNGYTSQETRDRVQQAIEECGYRPNLVARQLATRHTRTLGLVVTNTLYHGVYFGELLSQVARMTEDRGASSYWRTASTAPTRSARPSSICSIPVAMASSSIRAFLGWRRWTDHRTA